MNDNDSNLPKLTSYSKQSNERYNNNGANNHNDNNRSYPTKSFTKSMIFRVFALILLLLLFLIPVSFLDNFIDEGFKSKQSTVDKLSQQWGNQQFIIGPILSIPYVERISRIESQTDSEGNKSSVSRDIFTNKTLMLLPENLSINAELQEKTLSEDEVQADVYQGEIELSGNFNLELLPEPSAYNSIEWDKAFLAIGLNNNTSVEASSPLRWEGSSSPFKPGTQLPVLLKQGFHANLEDVANDNKSPKFQIQLSVKGHQSLNLAPFGDLTSTTIKSDSANFIVKGDLVASSKMTTNDSFEATWRTTNLVRNYPQNWLIEEDKKSPIKPNFSSVMIGVELRSKLQATDKFQLKIKSIVSTIIPMLSILFLSLLVLEFKRNSKSKPKFLHYIVVALPILLTPILLMTLNGLANFTQAYQIVAGTGIVLIALYVMSALKSFTRGFYILLIVASLFAALFVKLEIPEFTLYAYSTAGLFIIVILMMVSANIKEDK